MDLVAFRATMSEASPPDGLSPSLEALWRAGNGAWDAAHGIVQTAGEGGDADADWVHAYLHRVEGDLGNAGYWYRRAGRPVASGSLDDEWAVIVTDLLRRP